MTSTMETHPPVRTFAMVRTGASKVEIISPQNAGTGFPKVYLREALTSIWDSVPIKKRGNRTSS
jgi:hypothetical protein